MSYQDSFAPQPGNQKLLYLCSMDTITWHDFEKVELRAGTVLEVLDFPEARKPAYKLRVDFGEFGTRWSSALRTTARRASTG